jgi:hypothetical protein
MSLTGIKSPTGEELLIFFSFIYLTYWTSRRAWYCWKKKNWGARAKVQRTHTDDTVSMYIEGHKSQEHFLHDLIKFYYFCSRGTRKRHDAHLQQMSCTWEVLNASNWSLSPQLYSAYSYNGQQWILAATTRTRRHYCLLRRTRFRNRQATIQRIRRDSRSFIIFDAFVGGQVCKYVNNIVK